MNDIVPVFTGQKASHSLSFNVLTRGPEEWEAVYGQMTRMAAQWGPYHTQVSVSSVLLEEDVVAGFPGEYHDEGTLFKVREALAGVCRSFDLPEDPLVNAFINEMQNRGILFREAI